MDPLVNRAWISGRPLHYLADKPPLANGPPQSIEHGSLVDHYTIWKTNLLWAMDLPSQLNMDLWKTITPNNFHNRLNPAPSSN